MITPSEDASLGIPVGCTWHAKLEKGTAGWNGNGTKQCTGSENMYRIEKRHIDLAPAALQ